MVLKSKLTSCMVITMLTITTYGTYPNIYSPKYTAPLKVSDFSKFKAISVAPDKTHHSLTFESNAKAGKRKGKHL